MEGEGHKRTVLALVLRYLHDAGYEGAYTSLSVDSGLSLEQADVAAAVSLSNVVKDYESLYVEKHGSAPELTNQQQPHPQVLICLQSPLFLDEEVFQGLRLRPEMIMGTTKLFGTSNPVSQVDFFRVLCSNRSLDPTSLFFIELPLSCARRFRPSQLTLTSVQEHVLYGLVGCSDVGWRLSSVSQNSRTILEERYAITKRTLQLFFKNRCQQKQRRKRKKVKEEEQPSTEDLQQSELLEGLVPIAPAPCPSDVLHINSLLEMVKGDEFEAATDVPVALITSQSHEAYEPAAHLTVSTPAQLP